MQGARMTRTAAPSFAGSASSRCSPPAIAQESESHTRTVIGGGGRLALLHHVEMRVEGRDLVDLRKRELHLACQRSEMRGREMAVLVLDQMEVLDQQVAAARALAKERADFLQRARGRPGGLSGSSVAGGGRARIGNYSAI